MTDSDGETTTTPCTPSAEDAKKEEKKKKKKKAKLEKTEPDGEGVEPESEVSLIYGSEMWWKRNIAASQSSNFTTLRLSIIHFHPWWSLCHDMTSLSPRAEMINRKFVLQVTESAKKKKKKKKQKDGDASE